MTARPRTLAISGVLATALAAGYACGVRFDSGVEEALPGDVPAVKSWQEMLRRFDAFDSWLVGLEEPGGSLSLEGLRHVDLVTRRLEALKADGVLAARSVSNVQALREGADGAVDTGPLVAALPTDGRSLEALKRSILGNPQVLGALVSRDLSGYAVVVRADPRKDPVAVARRVEHTVESARGPLRAYYLGAPFFADAPLERLSTRLRWIAPLFLALLLGLFLAGVRRPARVAFVAGAAGASLVFWLALVRALGHGVSPASAGVALGWFAVAGATLAGFGETAALGERRWPPAARVGLCLAAIALGGWVAWRAPVLCTPQDMFSPKDEVGRSLAFFDRRFGGGDFLQVDWKGDLTDPAVAARLLRFSDLLEGSPGLTDVRSVAQVLAFLNHGFGDAHRIPPSRSALANLWFFLEGNGDVRSLVSDRRDEALVVVRIPSHPSQGVAALVGEVEAAVAASAAQGTSPTVQRILAIGRASEVMLDPARVAAVTAAATRAPSVAEAAAIEAEVASRLRRVLASPDSPWQPSDADWQRLVPALAGDPADLRSRLTVAVRGLAGLGRGQDVTLVDMLAERERDVRRTVRSERLAAQLLPAGSLAPETFRTRAEGAVADLLDPQQDGGRVRVEVSGMPVVAPAISASLRSHLWRTLALIFGLGVLLFPFLGAPAAARRFLVAATATALTFLACRAASIAPDVGSVSLYLLPAVLGLFTPAARRGPRSLLLALGAAMLALLLGGALPVTRVAAVAAAGLGAVVLSAWWVGENARSPGGPPVPVAPAGGTR